MSGQTTTTNIRIYNIDDLLNFMQHICLKIANNNENKIKIITSLFNKVINDSFIQDNVRKNSFIQDNDYDNTQDKNVDDREGNSNKYKINNPKNITRYNRKPLNTTIDNNNDNNNNNYYSDYDNDDNSGSVAVGGSQTDINDLNNLFKNLMPDIKNYDEEMYQILSYELFVKFLESKKNNFNKTALKVLCDYLKVDIPSYEDKDELTDKIFYGNIFKSIFTTKPSSYFFIIEDDHLKFYIGALLIENIVDNLSKFLDGDEDSVIKSAVDKISNNIFLIGYLKKENKYTQIEDLKNYFMKELKISKNIIDSVKNIIGKFSPLYRSTMNILNHKQTSGNECNKKFKTLQTTTFKSKDCSSGNEIDAIVKKLCNSQVGGYFGVGGTTPKDLAGMLMTGGANFVNQVSMDKKNYTNTLVDTLNKLINQVQAKGMVINSADANRLNNLMIEFSNKEKEVIKDIQTLYKLYENSKYLEKDVLKNDPAGKTSTKDFELKELNSIDETALKDLTEKLSKYKKTEGKLLLTYDKLLSCLKSSSP